MRGDKLIVKPEHRRAAAQLLPIVQCRLESNRGCLAVTIAGESGAGKSEIAAVLAEKLIHEGMRTVLLQQDDYFVHPPKTNARIRRASLEHVGVGEVRLDVLERNVHGILAGAARIVKPLVDYEGDLITEEEIDVSGARVVIAEGTYTTLLPSAGLRVFIDRTYHDTETARAERAREAQDEYLRAVLQLEHVIISAHRALADVLVDRAGNVLERTRREEAPSDNGSGKRSLTRDVRGR